MDQLKLLDILVAYVTNEDRREHFNSNMKSYKAYHLNDNELNNILTLDTCNEIVAVPNITKEMFYQVVQKNMHRYKPSTVKKLEDTTEYRIISNFVNAACNPAVIHMMKINLLNKSE